MFRRHKPRTTAATISTISTPPGMPVFTRANGHHLPPLPCSCYRPAAGATLQGLCRKGYGAHAPTAALAIQIGILQLLHWPHRSACSNCCTGHTDQHAPSVALAAQLSMLQVLHWQQGSAYSTCTAAPLVKGGRRTTRKRSKFGAAFSTNRKQTRDKQETNREQAGDTTANVRYG